MSATLTVLAAAMPANAFIPSGRIGIGDSVMRGATNELHARGIRVDTAVSRQFSSLPELMRHLKNRDKYNGIGNYNDEGFAYMEKGSASTRR